MRMDVLGAVLGVAIAAAAGAAPAQEARTVTVAGHGEVQIVPDIAVIDFGVIVQAPEASAAMDQARLRLREIFAALDGLEIPDEDRQTQVLSLSPVYERSGPERDGAPEITGYRAQNTVRVILRDVSEIGGAVDVLSAAGVNSFGGISFDVSDPGETLDEARRKAVADARHRAEVLAEEAGVELGPVLTIRDNAYRGGPSPVMMRMADAAEATPVAAGSVALSADVEVVFGIR